MKNTPQTVTATLPWIEQVEASLAPNELGGVAKGLRRRDAAAGAADAPNRSPSSKQTELFNKCLTKVLYPGRQHASCRTARRRPASRTTRSSGTRLTGLAGIGQNFDGNGTMTHFLLGSGGPTVRSQPASRAGHATSKA